MAIIIDFDEVELNREYSPQATGGPTYQTSIIGNAKGVHQRNVNLYDAIRTWNISFDGMTTEQILALESFFIQRRGMSTGFRFLPPHDNSFDDDFISNTTAGNLYSLIRNYSGITRRIVKPVYLSPVILYDGNVVPYFTGSAIIYPTTPYTQGEWPEPPALAIEMNWDTGVFSFYGGTFNTVPYTVPSAGTPLRAFSGEYNVPVVFTTDQMSAQRQLTFSDWQGVGLMELLPANLGIT